MRQRRHVSICPKRDLPSPPTSATNLASSPPGSWCRRGRLQEGARARCACAPFARGFDMTIDSLLGSMDCTNLATSSACMASSSAAGCRDIPATASLAFFLLSEATRTASPEGPHLDPSKLPKLPSSPLGTRLAAPAARAPSRRTGSAMVEDARPSLLFAAHVQFRNSEFRGCSAKIR